MSQEISSDRFRTEKEKKKAAKKSSDRFQTVVRKISVKFKETLERFAQESQEISSDRFRTVVGK